jgi:glutamyl-tRNA synthetase
LQWAGLQWDEGPGVGGSNGPYWQSERNALYQKHAQDLLDQGAAYRCFCTPQTAGAGTAAFVTSGCYQDCSHISTSEASERAESGSELFTVRLKQPENVHKRTYPDLIYGNIKRLKRSPAASTAGDEEGSLDAADTILMKSDGTPTYHFANVVDDHLMKITHVIRGTEWMASTPLHYDLYTAFGWQPPIFAHVGLLLDKDKAKLSKRNADLALDVKGLREDHGVLPETLYATSSPYKAGVTPTKTT